MKMQAEMVTPLTVLLASVRWGFRFQGAVGFLEPYSSQRVKLCLERFSSIRPPWSADLNLEFVTGYSLWVRCPSVA